PASLWKSVLIAAPVMYLVQGIFLFDVLPIYLGLFVLLMFVLNTNPLAGELPALPEATEFAGWAYGAQAVIIAGIATTIYATGYLPLRRNVMIVSALSAGEEMISESASKPVDQLSVTPAQVFSEFHQAIDWPSPIGRGEAIEMYQKFVIDLLGAVSQ